MFAEVTCVRGVAVSNVCVPNVPLRPDCVLQCLFQWPTFRRAYVNKIEHIWSQTGARFAADVRTSACRVLRVPFRVFCARACVCVLPFFCKCTTHNYIKEKRERRWGRKTINQAPPLALLPRWFWDSINEPRSLFPWKPLWMRKGPVTLETVWIRNCLIGPTLWWEMLFRKLKMASCCRRHGCHCGRGRHLHRWLKCHRCC